MNSVPGWIDDFLFLDATLVATLTLADFLIGKKGRAAMREKVGDWWLMLQEVTFVGFESTHAGKIRRWLERFFGKRWFSPKFFLRTALLSIGITFCAAFLLNYILSRDESGAEANIPSLVYWAFSLYFPIYIANLLADWSSLAITIFLLKKMEQSVQIIRLILLIVVDLAAVILLSCAAFAVAVQLMVIPQFPSVLAVYGFISYMILVNLFFIIALTSVLPSLAHLLVAVVFCLSKLFRPVLQKPLELALLRFHESEKGILTLLAIGLGALAKTIQETVKYFAGT